MIMLVYDSSISKVVGLEMCRIESVRLEECKIVRVLHWKSVRLGECRIGRV